MTLQRVESQVQCDLHSIHMAWQARAGPGKSAGSIYTLTHMCLRTQNSPPKSGGPSISRKETQVGKTHSHP